MVAEGRWKGTWVGLGCAACHSGQLEYQGTKVRLMGGNNNTLDMHSFVYGLDEALAATAADPEKIDRLAERMGRGEGDAKAELRERLERDAATLREYRTGVAMTPTVVGPGRMDALTLIHNQVQARRMGVPENWESPLAPVKPSFMWNTFWARRWPSS